MNKYKEYLRKHGVKLNGDLGHLYCYGLACVDTCVLDDGIVAVTRHVNGECDYVAYVRCGEHGWNEVWGEVPYEELERFGYSMGYIDWLRNMCSALTADAYASVFETMKRMYLDDAKVRIGYKHMRAGIMDMFVFAKWLAKRYQKGAASGLDYLS